MLSHGKIKKLKGHITACFQKKKNKNPTHQKLEILSTALYNMEQIPSWF